MGLLTVQGIYKDGKIELIERPDHVDEAARVLVTFLPASGSPENTTLGEGQEREALRQRAFARMKEGIHLGGPPYPKREELYDRSDR
jgi:hypothetical protein